MALALLLLKGGPRANNEEKKIIRKNEGRAMKKRKEVGIGRMGLDGWCGDTETGWVCKPKRSTVHQGNEKCLKERYVDVVLPSMLDAMLD